METRITEQLPGRRGLTEVVEVSDDTKGLVRQLREAEAKPGLATDDEPKFEKELKALFDAELKRIANAPGSVTDKAYEIEKLIGRLRDKMANKPVANMEQVLSRGELMRGFISTAALLVETLRLNHDAKALLESQQRGFGFSHPDSLDDPKAFAQRLGVRR